MCLHYLAIAVAAFRGRTKLDEEELVRIYGSSSPGRIRGLPYHLERSDLTSVREDFACKRSISVLRLEGPYRFNREGPQSGPHKLERTFTQIAE